MIGDGINDVLSLQEATIGVCINSSCELNLVASDIILLNECLWNIPYIFDLVNFANLLVKINLFWAFLYNLCMIPIAMGCFCHLGV